MSVRLRTTLLLALLLGGCGYGFSVGRAGLPAGVSRVSVDVFDNRTGEAQAGAIFSEALSGALARSGVSIATGAPTRVEGIVESIAAAPAATDRDGLGVGLYRLSASLQLRVVEGARTVCTRRISGSESYSPASDLLELEAGRGAALRRLALTMMENASRELCE